MGRMDANHALEFDQACTRSVDLGVRHLIIDMTELTYVSSMGLRYLVNVGKSLSARDGSLRLCGVHGLVKQLLQITHLSDAFPVHDSVESALAAL